MHGSPYPNIKLLIIVSRKDYSGNSEYALSPPTYSMYAMWNGKSVDLQKAGAQNATQYEMCMEKDALFGTTWQLVHAWPQLQKDEVICIPSVHLSIQYEVLSAHKGCKPWDYVSKSRL